MAIVLSEYLPTIMVDVLLTGGTKYFATKDFYTGGVYYKGTLLDGPQISRQLSDLYHGVEQSTSIILRFANRDNDIDDTWDDIVVTNADEPRGRWVLVQRNDPVDGTSFEFRGKITKYRLGPIVELTIEMRDDYTLETLLPLEVVTTDGFTVTALDIGEPVNLCFGYCRNVPLRNIQNNLGSNLYDYLIGYGNPRIENVWEDATNGIGVKRDGVLVDTTEYTFYDGSQGAPHAGYAFLRFTTEQMDFSGKHHKLTADVKGYANTHAITAVNTVAETFGIAGDYTAVFTAGITFRVDGSTGNDGNWVVSGSAHAAGTTTITITGNITNAIADGNILVAERNFARVVEDVLSDATWGLNDSVDATSFTAGAAALDTIGDMWCDGSVVAQRQARDILDDLLFPARARIERASDGEWEITVDVAGASVLSVGDNDGYYNNAEVKSTSAPSTSEALTKAVLHYALNPTNEDMPFKEMIATPVHPGFGVTKTYEMKFVHEDDTAERVLSYIKNRSLFSDKTAVITVGMEGRDLSIGDIVTVTAPSRNLSADEYMIEGMTKGISDFNLECREYSASIYGNLAIASPTPPTARNYLVKGPATWVGPIILGDGVNQPGTITLTVAPGQGDIYIAAGKTDFTNAANGFIIGIDDSDADKVKMYLGDATENMYWDGSNLYLTGTITANAGVIGGWNIVTGYLYNLRAGTPTAAPEDGVVLASGNEALIVYEDTEKRIEVGYLAAGVYGIKGYATDGATIIFEMSDSQQKIAGWLFDATSIADNAVAANANIYIDSANTLIRCGPTTGDYLTLDGANLRLRSSNYVAGMAGAGFTLEPDLLEVGNIAARGIVRTAVFQKDIISAIGGTVAVSKGSDVLATTMTQLDACNLTIEGNETFAVNDILRIKDDTNDEWMLVTNVAGAPTYVVTRDQATAYAADNNPAWTKGATVVNYGPANAGILLLTNTPYIDMLTHAGAPWTTTTRRMRIGDLNGTYGYGAATYGIALGAYSAADYVTIEDANGVRFLDAGDVVRAQLSAGVWTLGVTTDEHVRITATSVEIKDGATVYTELSGGTLILGNIAAEHIRITGTGVELKDAANVYGIFAATTTLGLTASEHINITNAKVEIKDGATVFTTLEAGKLSLGMGGAIDVAIYIKDATYGNDGIQLEYNAGSSRIYVGDGANAFFQFDGTKIQWKGANTELDASGNLVCTGGQIGGFYLGANDIWGGNAAIGNAATTIVIGNLDGTSKIALGPSADAITVAGVQTGFIVDGAGNLRVGDASSFLKWSGGALTIQLASGESMTIKSGGDLILESAAGGASSRVHFVGNIRTYYMGIDFDNERLCIYPDTAGLGSFYVGLNVAGVSCPFHYVFIRADNLTSLEVFVDATHYSSVYLDCIGGVPAVRMTVVNGGVASTFRMYEIYALFSTRLGIGGKVPNVGTALAINLPTEDLEVIDAGSAGATEQDWVQVEVGGNVGYLRVFAAK